MLRLFLAVAIFCAAPALLAAPASGPAALLELHPNPHWQSGLDRNDANIAAEAIARARAQGLLGCRRYCAMLTEVFARVRQAAHSQLPEQAAPALELIVTRLPDEAAWALSDGHVFISEVFIHDARLNRHALAFVLAHEVAHALLRDQADTLDLARALIPLGVNASVEDIYATLNFDLGVLIELAPLLQAMEAEADRVGLIIAALAGFKPDAALGFLRQLQAQQPRHSLVASHPQAGARLALLAATLPMARRIQAMHGRTSGPRFYSSSPSSSSPVWRRGTVAGSQMMGR